MSTTPISVGPSATLGQCKKLMNDNSIRHLPVVTGDALVGLMTQSDLRVIEGLSGVHPEQVKAEDVMQRSPFTCGPESLLDEVVDEMVSHKWGSCVVMQNHKVVGIFTSIDAMRALVELARSRLNK